MRDFPAIVSNSAILFVLLTLICVILLSGCITSEPRTEHKGIIDEVTFTDSSNHFYIFFNNYTSYALITGDSDQYKIMDACLLAKQNIGNHVRMITEQNVLKFFETLD